MSILAVLRREFVWFGPVAGGICSSFLAQKKMAHAFLMLPSVVSDACVVVTVYRTPTTIIASDSTHKNTFCMFFLLVQGLWGS